MRLKKKNTRVGGVINTLSGLVEILNSFGLECVVYSAWYALVCAALDSIALYIQFGRRLCMSRFPLPAMFFLRSVSCKLSADAYSQCDFCMKHA